VSQRFGDNTPVVKLDLKRADAAELIGSDPVLAASPFARAVGAELKRVCEKAVVRRFPDKVVLMQQGDVGHSLFFVMKGDIRLFARKGSDTVELGAAHRGEVVGEVEVLEASPRAYTAVAQGEVDAVELPRDALFRSGRLLPALAAHLGELRQRRQRALDELTDFLNRW
jgi:CRP-like cAMP-binding protein